MVEAYERVYCGDFRSGSEKAIMKGHCQTIRPKSDSHQSPDPLSGGDGSQRGGGEASGQVHHAVPLSSAHRTVDHWAWRAVTMDSASPPIRRRLWFPSADGPFAAYEEFGVEDPRMTHIDGEYLITYSAYSRNGVRIALAKTKDFNQRRKGQPDHRSGLSERGDLSREV